jgi:hypothetical protein
LRISQSELCRGISKLGNWNIFFQGLFQLKELDVSYCDIITIKNEMFNLATFRASRFTRNMLSNFDEVETCIFPILQNLTSLSLSRNLYTVIVPGPNFQQYMQKHESVIDLFV